MGLKSQKRKAPQTIYRLGWALLLSFAFHALTLGIADMSMRARPPAPNRTVLQAELRPLQKEIRPDAAEKELKNTIVEPETEPAPAVTARPSAGAKKIRKAETLSEQKLERVLEKLSDRVFYPPEAVANGWEGETVLLVEMDRRGAIERVSVASSSGYAVLDEAAIRALSGRRSLGPDLQGKAVLVPIRFELD